MKSSKQLKARVAQLGGGRQVSVKTLIANAQKSRAKELPAAALADLEEVLAHNKQRQLTPVTMGAFIEHLRKAHKVEMHVHTLARLVRRRYGRGWCA